MDAGHIRSALSPICDKLTDLDRVVIVLSGTSVSMEIEEQVYQSAVLKLKKDVHKCGSLLQLLSPTDVRDLLCRFLPPARVPHVSSPLCYDLAGRARLTATFLLNLYLNHGKMTMEQALDQVHEQMADRTQGHSLWSIVCRSYKALQISETLTTAEVIFSTHFSSYFTHSHYLNYNSFKIASILSPHHCSLD